MSSRLITRLVKLQRAAAVRGFVGPNGGGKTASAVASVLPSLAAGRPVLSNIRILDFERPRPCDDSECDCDKTDPDRHGAAHPNYRPLRTWRQVVEADHCDVLFDEISSTLSSRDTAGLPGEVEVFLQQPRKPDVAFVYTCPAWARTEKVMREVTRQVIFCRDEPWFRRTVDSGDRMWREGRLFRQAGFDATELDKFENGKRDTITPLYQGVWWGPGSVRFQAYDTYEYVPLMGARASRGACLDCGLKRGATAATCKGHDEQESANSSEDTPRRAMLLDIKKGPAGTGPTTTTEGPKIMRSKVSVNGS